MESWGEVHNDYERSMQLTAGHRMITRSRHVYQVRPRKDKRGVDLTSDALPFGRLWYVEPGAISNAKFYSRLPRCSDSRLRFRFLNAEQFGTILAVQPFNRFAWEGRK